MKHACILALALMACNTDTKTDDPSDTEPQDEVPTDTESSDTEVEAECDTDGDCAEWEICEATQCEAGDRNNALDEAESMVWDETVTTWLNNDGDVDWFTFEAEGGEFVKITTVTDAELDQDTKLVIRNPASKVHYTAYDYPTGGSLSSLDAVAYVYLPDAGTWSIAVEHDTSTDTDPDYGEDYVYELSLSEWTVYTEEEDSAEEPSLTITPTDGSFWPIGVHLGEAGDVDYVNIAFPYDGGVFYTVGMADLGASDATPLVTLLGDDGETLSSKENVGPDGYLTYPALPNDVYSLQLTDADGGGGDDHWFFVFLRTYDEDSAYPSEEEDNDDASSANAIEWYETSFSSGEPYYIGWIQGLIDDEGDEDWFSLEIEEAGSVVVCANSASQGSGAAVSLALMEDEDEEIASVTGDASADPTAELDNISVESGSVSLVVSDPDATGGAGDWYRARIIYAPDATFSSWSCP